MKYFEVLVEDQESICYQRAKNIENALKILEKKGKHPYSYEEITKDEYYETIFSYKVVK